MIDLQKAASTIIPTKTSNADPIIIADEVEVESNLANGDDATKKKDVSTVDSTKPSRKTVRVPVN